MASVSIKPDGLDAKALAFAQECRKFVSSLQKTVTTMADAELLVSSSESIVANCIEANKSLSGKDFDDKIKVCKQEAKKTILWLRLTRAPSELVQEATELVEIFGEVLKIVKH